VWDLIFLIPCDDWVLGSTLPFYNWGYKQRSTVSLRHQSNPRGVEKIHKVLPFKELQNTQLLTLISIRATYTSKNALPTMQYLP